MSYLEKILNDIADFNFEKLNPLYQGFFVMVFFAVFVSTCSYFSNEAKISKDAYKEMFHEKISGIIVKKFLDKHNHMSRKFILKDSTQIYVYPVLWEKAEIGDSLFKKVNSKFVKIFKKDTTIVIDMNVAFKYRDSIPENEK